MPNWVLNRVTLSGPQAELERFQKTCIRYTPDHASEEESLDFGALVPMPAEIAATLDDCSPTAKQAALTATGFESWYEWCLQYWGCKWNAADFEMITEAPGLLDIFFHTPWSAAEPALSALAARYPLLSGRVCAIEPDGAWGLVGEFQGGSYTSTPVELSPELRFLVYGWMQHPEIRLKTGLALAGHPDQAGELNNAVLAGIWASLFATLAPELAACLRLSFDVEHLNDWYDSASSGGEPTRLEDVVQTPATLAFLTADGRCYSPIDRQLLHLLAQTLLAEWDQEPDEMKINCGFLRSIAYLLFDYTEDELRNWAFHAAFRPGADVNFTDLRSLQESFLLYAADQRREMLQHLRALRDCKHHPCAAVAAEDVCWRSQVASV